MAQARQQLPRGLASSSVAASLSFSGEGKKRKSVWTPTILLWAPSPEAAFGSPERKERKKEGRKEEGKRERKGGPTGDVVALWLQRRWRRREKRLKRLRREGGRNFSSSFIPSLSPSRCFPASVPPANFSHPFQSTETATIVAPITPSQGTPTQVSGMETDRETYEKARMLKVEYIGNIRAAYMRDFTSEDEVKQQKAVATYLIDKLGLSSGTEKTFGTTVSYGCCAIKVENLRGIPPSSLEFNFHIKDITSKITLEVDFPVIKAILQLQTGKHEDDYLFDKLDTTKLNTHLNELMPGLTIEVFRIYNTSVTLENMLNKENTEGDISDRIKVFSHACYKVFPIIHSNATTYTTVMSVMRHNARQIDKLQGTLAELKKSLANSEEGKLLKDDEEERELTELPEWKIARTAFSIRQLKRRMEERPRPYPLTSMIEYYYDPRIAVAWCRCNGVPVEEIIPTVRLTKCAWALDVGPDFRF
ncbi:hypothetical protein ACLB2K_062323 [Fragaria x ananassa]